MNTRKSLRGAALLLLIFVFLQTAAAGDRWTRVRSENFNLVGSADEAQIRAVAFKLEQFRAALRQVLGGLNFDSPIPTTVIVFKNAADYRPFKPLKLNGEIIDQTVGYFQAGRDVNYITLAAGDQPAAQTYGIIFHEYTHFLIRNNLGESTVPPWYNEGTANYYETFAVDNNRKVTLGGAPSKYLTVLAQNNLIPFETFFAVDNISLHERGAAGAGLFYAQAWALVHYLRHGEGGARKPQLDTFLSLVTAGKNPTTAFADAFKTDYAQMESALKKYIGQKVFTSVSVNLKSALSNDFEMSAALLPDSEAEAYLGDLLYHSDRLPEAETHLKNALKLNPDSGAALSALGLIKMRQKNFAEAEEYLEKAVRADSENYRTHYDYAVVLSNKGMSEFGFVSEYARELADKMRFSLLRAIELNPRFAESYSLYAFVNTVRNEEISRSIAFIDTALKIAPGNQWYQLRLAELYLRREEFSDARRIAARVAQTAADKELKIYSENTLRLINTTEAAYIDIKNYNKRNRIKDYLDRILTDEEFAILREQRILESINEALYKPKPGEKRVLGYLTQVVCEPNKMIYLARVDDKIIKLRSSSFYAVKLTAYAAGMSDWQISCGKTKKENLAVINYRPAENIDELVSIEFVPENFKLRR